MKRLKLTKSAKADLMEIGEYIAAEDPDAADTLLDQIEAAAQLLRRFPLLGRLREDMRPGMRGFAVRGYLLLYRASEDEVTLVRVAAPGRDLGNLF